MLAAAIMIITVPGLGSGAGSGTAKVPSSLSGGLGEGGDQVICTPCPHPGVLELVLTPERGRVVAGHYVSPPG